MIELAKIDLDDSKFKSSIRDFHHAYELNDNLDYVYGKMVHTKMLLNDWSDFNKQLKIIENGLENNRRIIILFLFSRLWMILKNTKIILYFLQKLMFQLF
jgi:tetratricopeptide (TPR) repeat protein